MSSKAKDKQLMPPPLPKARLPLPKAHLPKAPLKTSSRTSAASVTLLSLNPAVKQPDPNKVTYYQIQVKQMLMENMRHFSMQYVDPPTPLETLELIRKLLLVAQTF